MSDELYGKTALVTGAASGIGLAASELFADQGAMVIVADINLAIAQEVAMNIVANGGQSKALYVDVGDPVSVASLFSQIKRECLRLDAAFNNAGISDSQCSWIDFPLEQWQRMIDVNLNGVFYCLREELKLMSEQQAVDGLRGQIVNTSSGAGLIPAPGQPHYTAAKHAVLGLTRSAAQDFSHKGIRVNSILPGLTETPMIESQPQSMLDTFAKMSPTGRLGQPIDIAKVAVWLCSPAAQWVNGQAIVADGGGLMH